MPPINEGETMEPPTTRAFGPGRIAALALIAIAAAGLAYLRFAPDAKPVSVPKGAHAGQLTLRPCHYAPDAGSSAADGGTPVVPENRGNAGSRLIALPATRSCGRAAQPAEP